MSPASVFPSLSKINVCKAPELCPQQPCLSFIIGSGKHLLASLVLQNLVERKDARVLRGQPKSHWALRAAN